MERLLVFGLEKDIPFSPNLTCYAAGSNTGSYCISPMYITRFREGKSMVPGSILADSVRKGAATVSAR